jgi:hypothetical protein
MPGEHSCGKQAGDARANDDRMVAYNIGSHYQLRPAAEGAAPGCGAR